MYIRNLAAHFDASAELPLLMLGPTEYRNIWNESLGSEDFRAIFNWFAEQLRQYVVKDFVSTNYIDEE